MDGQGTKPNGPVGYRIATSAASATVSTPAGTVQTIAINVFIEIFGQAMTLATFLFWIVI